MKYDGPLLDILWFENGHALVASETREDTAHVVDLHDQTCSCENATIDKNKNCKHIRFVRAINEEIQKIHSKEYKEQQARNEFLMQQEKAQVPF